jgi:hypothetical protein
MTLGCSYNSMSIAGTTDGSRDDAARQVNLIGNSQSGQS